MKKIMIASLCLFLASPLSAQTHICQTVVDSELQKVGVAKVSIASTRIERDYNYIGDGDRKLDGYTYWIRMKACQKGYLLVTLRETCDPIGTPATVDGCEIAGVHKC